MPLVARFRTPPVLWPGTADANRPVMFHVLPDGSECRDFWITINCDAPGCNVRGEPGMSNAGPRAITDGQFLYDDTMFAFSGTFDSAAEAHGTYSIRGVKLTISFPYPPYECLTSVSAEGTWVAGG
ncbi:MAG: hypothetical protein BWY10_00842 [Chloroflexi bacterium ADurb.Bin180]|nr:MAG: hypothetical protein BWY10_00842 [Chloroflexi bacterium ADurb.Bin180]